ncbi:hypothetical protein H2200_004982 [Cladophialophora chaetospira]|uniref:Uncharacterized protein n=1 Tax=Cladophialophora chaetospira TaxID=386627 RepID=A0AA38XB45_9EURO|nr:hypothetical protein H2200_004982 [Cladophialophora chaetospira]
MSNGHLIQAIHIPLRLRNSHGQLPDADEATVTVSAEFGDEPAHLFVIKNHLLNSSDVISAFFQGKTKGTWKILRDVPPEVFEKFSTWLSTKEVFIEEMMEALALREFERSVEGEDDSSEEEEDDSSEEEEDDRSDDVEMEDDAFRAEVVICDDSNDMDCDDDDSSDMDCVDDSSDQDSDDSSHREGDDISIQAGNEWYSHLLTEEDRVFARMVELYIFGDKYKSVDFRRVIMLQMQRFVGNTERCPGFDVVKYAVDRLDLNTSPICRYLVHIYYNSKPRKWNSDLLATLQPQFLAQVLLLIYQALDGGPVATPYDDWCDYHEHESAVEREECQAGRPDDINLQVKTQNADNTDSEEDTQDEDEMEIREDEQEIDV